MDIEWSHSLMVGVKLEFRKSDFKLPYNLNLLRSHTHFNLCLPSDSSSDCKSRIKNSEFKMDTNL